MTQKKSAIPEPVPPKGSPQVEQLAEPVPPKGSPQVEQLAFRSEVFRPLSLPVIALRLATITTNW